MKKLAVYFSIALALLTAGGCALYDAKPQLTSLEIQAVQSRDFDADKRLVFASVMSVFQDLGYIVESANFDTGFITAKSPTKSAWDFFMGMATKTTKATAFIEELRPGVTKVRLNFVETKEQYNDQGAKTVNDSPVEDPQIYQNAFTKIGEAVFIRTGLSGGKKESRNATAKFPDSESGKSGGN